MVVIMMGLGACEKAVLDEQQEKKPVEGNVIIRASLYHIVPFETRAVESVADFSTHLQFVLFQNGTKVKTVKCPKGKADAYRSIFVKKGVPKTAEFK